MENLIVGIIPDGNRRYSKKHNLDFKKAYLQGMVKTLEILNYLQDSDVSEAVVYAFSSENLNRGKIFVNSFFNNFNKFLKLFLEEDYEKLSSDKDVSLNEELYERIQKLKNTSKIKIIGRRDIFNEETKELVEALEEKTKDNKKFTINIAICYGGKQEIVDCFKKLKNSDELSNIDENTISKHLYFDKDIDLVIRSGGFKRLSNFMLWQNSYSEFFFIDKLWPEISLNDIKKVLEDYSVTPKNKGF